MSDVEKATNEEQQNVFELIDNLYKSGAMLYDKTAVNSDFFDEFLKIVASISTDLSKFIENSVLDIDEDIRKRNSFMQKVVINRVLFNTLLAIKATTGMNVTNKLYLIDNGIQDEVWLNSLAESVLPFLAEYFTERINNE